MRYLSGAEEQEALEWLATTASVALDASCTRAQCGSIIVNARRILGRGFNSPPGDLVSQRRCANEKNIYDQKVTDKTCCVHAEQRAILDALSNAEHLNGSRLYFVRLNAEGEPARSGNPYCTICSKMALDTGIAEFVLWHEEGICVYDTQEYNNLSYRYNSFRRQ